MLGESHPFTLRRWPGVPECKLCPEQGAGDRTLNSHQQHSVISLGGSGSQRIQRGLPGVDVLSGVLDICTGKERILCKFEQEFVLCRRGRGGRSMSKKQHEQRLRG